MLSNCCFHIQDNEENTMNEQIIQTLLREAPSQILADVRPEETAAVAAAFEHLLRLVVGKDRSSVQSYIPDLDAFTLGIGKNIIKEISEIAPEKRLAHIQQELLDREIWDLDRRAKDLAERSLTGSPDLPALRAEAEPIKERIEELSREFEEKGIDWETRYGLTLSEDKLDCGFVLGEHHVTSMRLGRRIRMLKEAEMWPPAWYAELWLKDAKGK